MTATEVSTITLRTHTMADFTGDRRTNQDFVHTPSFDLPSQLLINESPCLKHNFVGTWLHHILRHNSTKNTTRQRNNHITTFNQRCHAETFVGTTVVIGNDQILRYIHQSTCQVTRVRCLQCRVGQTFPCTVRRDEVLKNRQTFSEVGRNRCFNDRSIRLCHQTSHPRKLTNLCSRTTRARISHHEDRVERILLNGIAFRIHRVFFPNSVHHLLRDQVIGSRPDVDHFVVLLTLGHKT